MPESSGKKGELIRVSCHCSVDLRLKYQGRGMLNKQTLLGLALLFKFLEAFLFLYPNFVMILPVSQSLSQVSLCEML